MEFKEFSNPENADYDITSSLRTNTPPVEEDKSIMMELINLVGFLEDGEWVAYGMTEEEYMNPTRATIEKVKQKLQNSNEVRKIK